MDFDYKKYSLEQLENWMHDCMSAGEATPQQIYDVIKGVVEENYYTYKEQTAKAYELLALLNNNGKGHIKAYDDCVDKVLSCDKDDPSLECKGAWNDFWEDLSSNEYQPEGRWMHNAMKEFYNQKEELNSTIKEIKDSGGYEWTPAPHEDKVLKWILPVNVDGLTGDCYINLPDDLLKLANLKEDNKVEWIPQNDGNYLIKKLND